MIPLGITPAVLGALFLRRKPTLAQLRKSIRARYALLAQTARVLIGPGLHRKPLKPKADLDVYISSLHPAGDSWVAGVHPADGDPYYDGYIVGTEKQQRYPTQRDALLALDQLLFAIVSRMSPFVEKTNSRQSSANSKKKINRKKVRANSKVRA